MAVNVMNVAKFGSIVEDSDRPWIRANMSIPARNANDEFRLCLAATLHVTSDARRATT
jgi:hypothetical protein